MVAAKEYFSRKKNIKIRALIMTKIHQFKELVLLTFKELLLGKELHVTLSANIHMKYYEY